MNSFLAVLQPKAEADLEYAFNASPANAWHNKRLCLYYLVPVRLLSGSLPTEAHLTTFKLQIYIPFVQVSLVRATNCFACSHQQALC